MWVASVSDFAGSSRSIRGKCSVISRNMSLAGMEAVELKIARALHQSQHGVVHHLIPSNSQSCILLSVAI